MSTRARDDEFEVWDGGRLIVNRRFAELFRAEGLTTFPALFERRAGEVVRKIGSRETRKMTISSLGKSEVFFVKRHEAPRWRDRIMPLLRLSQPIHGARNEWEAIRRFIAAGIPTMVPVAFGECGQQSLLVTQGLDARGNLLELIAATREHAPGERADERLHAPETYIPSAPGPSPAGGASDVQVRGLTERVAEIARKMHAAGLHHQDFYLNHILLCDEGGEGKLPDVRVIDLGRVRQHKSLATRWIIKDLAQLDFSARRLPCRERLRFLRHYLGRPITRQDRALIRRVTAKSRRIAAHTAKHGL